MICETVCAITEFGMIRNFNMFTRSLTNPNPAIGIPTQEQAIEYGILNRENLMTFYNIDVYRPYSPSNLASAHEIYTTKPYELIRKILTLFSIKVKHFYF